jgi:hypothetical protein
VAHRRVRRRHRHKPTSLKLELLTETGSVFVQIGDENVHGVRCLLDELFGRDNFVFFYNV